MSTYIVNLDGYYLEWSTVVDAPVTWGMSLSAFMDYYQNEYGVAGMNELDVRLARVTKKGNSAIGGRFSVGYNRAGLNESQLTRAEIVEWYCVRKEDPRKGVES